MEYDRVLIAAQEGDVQVLRTLRARVLSAKDSFGATALHHAARNGKFECVKWLVDILGMTGQEKTKNGASALHDAAATGQLECLVYLVKHAKVPVDQTDQSGHTPLHLAARFGWFDTVKWLVGKGGSNPRTKTRNRMNPVHFAASGESLPCLQLLVSKTDLSTVNDCAVDGTTPVYIAAQNGSFECLEYLKHVGGKCHIKSRDGMLPIHAAAQNGHLDCVALLVEDGLSSVEVRSPDGATPAHYAAAQGHLSVLKWLNAKGNITLNDFHNASPLHDAAEHGHFQCVKFLVDCCGLDMNQKDVNDTTPIELAGINGHRKCSDFLKIAAAKRAKAEKKLVGGLGSVSLDQFTRSRTSQKNDYGDNIPGKASAASQGKPATSVVERSKQFDQVKNTLNCNKNNQITTLIPQTREAHIEKSSSFQIGESSSNKSLSQGALVPKMTETDPTNLLANSSEMNGHPHGASSANHSEKGPRASTDSSSYSDLITRPPPTSTLPLPGVTDTSLQNGVFNHITTDLETPKSSYHLPLLKTIPSYMPTRFKGQKSENVDKIIDKTSSENTKVSCGSDVAAREGARTIVSADISSNALFTKASSVDHMNVKDTFELRILIDKMQKDLSSDNADEMFYAPNENHLPVVQNSSPTKSSSQHQESSQDLLGDELCASTVPPPPQFGDQTAPKEGVRSRSPGNVPNSSSTNITTAAKQITGEPTPQWKQQVYLNKLQKKKEKEKEQQKMTQKDHSKWEGVPKWKIPKLQEQEEQRLKRIKKLESLPEWKRNLLLRRESQFL